MLGGGRVFIIVSTWLLPGRDKMNYYLELTDFVLLSLRKEESRVVSKE